MVTAPSLTPIRRAVLDAIQASIDDRGYPPTVREICTAVGLRSSNTVHEHLKRLEADGYLRRDAGSPRAITLLEEPADG